MIKSEIIKIDYTNDISVIEKKFSEMGINPVRWAIIDANQDFLTINVSYEC